MRDHLPPLTAVRAFEAAARFESMSRAAEELGVTHSAVSRQIKALEAYLGVDLFARQHRQVVLTEEGRKCARQVGVYLDGLAAAFQVHSQNAAPDRLKIACDTDIAHLWLRPRLHLFRSEHPDIEVDIRASPTATRLPEDCDAAIILAEEPPTEGEAVHLFTNDLFVVCSPALVKSSPGLRRPADLAHHHLLHHQDCDEWATMLARLDVREADWRRGDIFSHTLLSYEAAAAGEGVAVGDMLTARQFLESGRLLAPFDVCVRSLRSPPEQYFVHHGSRRTPDRVACFGKWLAAQAREHREWFYKWWQTQG
jgi:LysR family glycine cleavage system transcriptional activator